MKIQWSRSLLLGATFTFITHSNLFPLSSARSNQRQTSRTTSHVTQKWDSSHPSWDHQECCLSLVMERNNNDDAMPRGGRWVIIRLFVTITIMLSRSKIVVFLLALHDTTICYFRPAPASASSRDLDFSSNSKSEFKNQDTQYWKNRNHITHILCKFSFEIILRD